MRIRLRKAQNFSLNRFTVSIELINMQQAFSEFCSLLTGYRSVNSGLHVLDRVFAAPVKKRSHVKLLTGMLQNVLDNGT